MRFINCECQLVCHALFILFLTVSAADLQAQDRETKVRSDKKNVIEDGYWIYNDLALAEEQAAKENKPLLVVFRCIPCEACAQLDAQIVEQDEVVKELMDQFVCVRIVHANGLDLTRFDYDFDQSFAAFLLHADGTIYGRYGTRSHQHDSADDVHIDGFAAALQGCLMMHKNHDQWKEVLQAKRGKPLEVNVPEEFASLKGKFGSKLNYEGNVVKSCIHCHQVGEARRLHYRDQGKPIPEKVLFPYPHPKILGLKLDPKSRGKILAVEENSSAAKSGFQKGDVIITLNQQPVLSMADIQWVLHHAETDAELQFQVIRTGLRKEISLKLEAGWREQGDLSWRATSWDLRRMLFGGQRLQELTATEKQEMNLPVEKMALLVKHVGQYGEHAYAKRAGMKKGDLIVGVDGKDDLLRETDLFQYLSNEKKKGEVVVWKVLRGKQKLLKKIQLR